MSKKKYLENPTEYSALSYWKSKNFKVPDNMKIVNDKYFSKDLLKDFNDDIYFKLVHNLNNIILSCFLRFQLIRSNNTKLTNSQHEMRFAMSLFQDIFLQNQSPLLLLTLLHESS